MYLGALMQEDGKIDKKVGARVQTGWMKSREGKGVLCNKRVPLKVKGKFYATVVRPAMTYVSECWALRKDQERRLQVAEMCMVRMMKGKLEKIGVGTTGSQRVLRWRTLETKWRRIE